MLYQVSGRVCTRRSADNQRARLAVSGPPCLPTPRPAAPMPCTLDLVRDQPCAARCVRGLVQWN
jgi:hypothetical protein